MTLCIMQAILVLYILYYITVRLLDNGTLSFKVVFITIGIIYTISYVLCVDKSYVSIERDTAIGNVVFPAMSAAEDKERLKAIGRRAMKTTSYIIFPIMIGLIVVSRPLILLLLTDKWSNSIIYMQILCLYWMTQPIQTTNWQIIKAIGRSDLCLKLEILKKAIGITMVVIAMYFGVFAIAVSAAIFGIISMVINILPNKSLIDYSIKEQLLDIFPALISAVIMGVGVYFISYLSLPVIIQFAVQIIFGAIIYVGISYVFKVESFEYILSIVKKKIK